MSGADRAARLLWRHWCAKTRLAALPADCRPETRAEGFAVQAAMLELAGERPAGWKIAATSRAGQDYLRVDGPIAGRLLSSRILESPGPVPLDGHVMCVAEAEFAFRLARPLPVRSDPFTVDEVVGAVAALCPAIEVPDSRFEDCSRVGAAQLIADQACASWFLPGPSATADWRRVDLPAHPVEVRRNGERFAEGLGANVLGDPRVALTWLANELCGVGLALAAGDIVTTGTCAAPVPVAPGDEVTADFGPLGSISARFV